MTSPGALAEPGVHTRRPKTHLLASARARLLAGCVQDWPGTNLTSYGTLPGFVEFDRVCRAGSLFPV